VAWCDFFLSRPLKAYATATWIAMLDYRNLLSHTY
jgi:hypothetical protein